MSRSDIGFRELVQTAPSKVGRQLSRWREPVARVCHVGLDLIFPPSCAACEVELPVFDGDRILLCQACRAEMVAHEPACDRCGARLGPQANCVDCQQRKFRFGATVRLGHYQGRLREAILQTKQSSQRALCMALANMLAAEHADRLAALQADVVTSIPMHWTRRLARGHNGPEIMAESLARRLRLPCAPYLLARRQRTRPQAELPPGKRFDNVRQAFKARRHADLQGAKVLLVDDIMTTGATCNAAARALRRAGAKEVVVAVIARAETP